MVTGAVRREPIRGLRPFNPARDIKQVAELLRMAFPEEMDRPEAAWLRDMETLGALKPIAWLANQINLALGGFFFGYVWIEDGQVVGNATLTRFSSQHWQVSNVAVHPDYRRRGIARHLMDACLDWLHERNARWVTLEVRRENTPARSLYQDMGFVVVNGTTEMQRQGTGLVADVMLPAGYQLRVARPADGVQMFELARQTMPALAQRIEPLRRQDYNIGHLGFLTNGVRWLLGLPTTLRWVITKADERVVAMLMVRVGGFDRRFRFLIHPDLHGLLEDALVAKALDVLSERRGTVCIKTDADNIAAIVALEARGFREVRTLDRMALELNQS